MNVEMKDYSGIAKAGLTTGIIGTGLGALNTLGDGLGGLLGGGGRMPACGGYGHADHAVNRFEFGMQMDFARELQAKDLEINALQSDKKFLEANTYTDQKMLEMYKYFDGQLGNINQQLCAQAVQNQANKDTFQLLQERLCSEAKARECADNSIVNYANATFYPKQVADVTVGTTMTAQAVYNPLPACSCNTGCC